MSMLLHTLVDQDGFHPRGREVSRVEAFSDVVFGFALTLLVVSLEVPKTNAELHAMLAGFAPFAICFWFLMVVWVEHYRFFRRFGLRDGTTVRLNMLLLFVVLFYVYPLKFLFTMVAGLLLRTRHGDVFANSGEIRELMVLYGMGCCLVYGLIALLNYQGWRQRRSLGLSLHEEVLTRSYIWDAGLQAGIGLVSCAVACVLPAAKAGYAGLAYLLIAIHKPVHGRYFDRRVKRVGEAEHDPEAAE